MAVLHVGQFFSVRHAFKLGGNMRVVCLGAADVSGFMVAKPSAPVKITINATPHTVVSVNSNAGIVTLGEDGAPADVFIGAELVIAALPPVQTATPTPSPSTSTPTPVPSTTTPVPSTPTPTPSTSFTESPDLTVVPTGSPFAITDSHGNAWSITPTAQIARNGVIDPPTNSVVQIAYVNHTFWQMNKAADWYYCTATGTPGNVWGPPTKTSPLPVKPAITVNPIGAQTPA